MELSRRGFLRAAGPGGALTTAFGFDVRPALAQARELKISRARMPKPRGGVNGLQAYGCLHVFGGEGNPGGPNNLHPDHDVYNPVTDTWTRLGPMLIPVHGVTGAAFLNGLIYLPGGGTSQGGNSGSLHHQVFRPNMVCR